MKRAEEKNSPRKKRRLKPTKKNKARLGESYGPTPVIVPPGSRERDPARPIPHKPPGTGTFTQEVADIICERLRNGENMNQICRDTDMPYAATVHRWKASDPDKFGKQLDLALDALYEYWANETMDISDDGSNDWMNRETVRGRIERVLDHEHIARSKLRVDTRKWLLGCLKRDKFGPHVQQEVTGKDGAPLIPVLNVIIDGGEVNGGSSPTNDAIPGSSVASEAGLGIPVKRD